MVRRIAIAAAALLLLLGGPASAQQKPWRHGIILAKSDAGIFFRVTKGFAAKEGIDLQLLQFKSDVIEIQALIAGELDSYDGGPEAAIVAAAHGADIKVLGCEWPGVPYAVFAKPSITSPKDLKGKIIAISQPGANPDVVARLMLVQAGVDPSTVTFANLGGDLDRFKAVVAGVADATVVSNEYTPIAQEQHLRLLALAKDVVPQFMRICIFATGKTLAARPDDAAHFLAAEMAALKYALTHRDETLALTHAIIHDKPGDPRAAFIYDDAVKTHAIDPEMHIPLDKLRWMEEQAVRDHVLAAPYDVAKMVDPGPREKALALLAK
jgi:NitT/TauT family transport system substrate-binding protein